MIAYWISKQNYLLQRHLNARPNQKEFWFCNIVKELDKFQKKINFGEQTLTALCSKLLE